MAEAVSEKRRSPVLCSRPLPTAVKGQPPALRWEAAAAADDQVAAVGGCPMAKGPDFFTAEKSDSASVGGGVPAIGP